MRDTRFDKDSKGQYVKIMDKFASCEHRFNQIDVEKTDKIFEIVKRSQNEQKVVSNELKTENNQGRNLIINHIN